LKVEEMLYEFPSVMLMETIEAPRNVFANHGASSQPTVIDTYRKTPTKWDIISKLHWRWL